MEVEIPDDKKATEHLANERTFLARVRMSIAIMSLGFVVAEFELWMHELGAGLTPPMPSHGSGMSAPIGIGMIGLGGALVVLAAWRFHVVNRQIAAGRVRVDRGLVVLVTVLVAAFAVVMIAYIGRNTAQISSTIPLSPQRQQH